jgi:hypothetical protein
LIGRGIENFWDMKREAYLNLRYVYIIILFTAVLCSCGKSPEEQLKSYLEYTILENDGESAYDLLSDEDQKYKTKEEFSSELKRKNLFNEKFLKKYSDLFNYEIIETKKLNEDTIKIIVSLTKPNTTNIVQEMLAMAMATSINRMPSPQKKELLEEQFVKIMKSEEVEVETEEKEFTLIRENGQYKVFLNLGYPHKLEMLNHKIESLEKEAEEKIRRIDFENALAIYQKIGTLKKDAGAENRIKNIEDILSHRIQLGEKIKAGNIVLKAEKVELRKIRIFKKNWASNTPIVSESEEPLFVLSFNVLNNCEGEVIEIFENKRYKRNNTIYDNFGNEMKEFLLDFDMMNIEGYEHKKIRPGESKKMIAVCEPGLSPKANKFIWKMNVFTDNKQTEQQIYISFSTDQIVVGQ